MVGFEDATTHLFDLDGQRCLFARRGASAAEGAAGYPAGSMIELLRSIIIDYVPQK